MKKVFIFRVQLRYKIPVIMMADLYMETNRQMELAIKNAVPHERGTIITWMSEFSEENCVRCQQMIDVMIVASVDGKKTQKKLKDIATPIAIRGGLDALQACYYIILHFMGTTEDMHPKFMKLMKQAFCGLDGWEN